MRLAIFLLAVSCLGQTVTVGGKGGGTGASLPSQTGNSGKFLTTNGSTASWATVLTAPYGLDITSGTTANLDHNYGTKDVYVVCVDGSSPYSEVIPETKLYTTTNRVTVTFSPVFTGRCAVISSSAGGGGGSMVYPSAGVANSTGSAWGAPYTVGTAANNLLQLNSSAQIPAVSGALVTSLNASALASGTVPTARLGSGTASNSTYLRGDGTWAAVSGGGGGAVYPIVFAGETTLTVTAATHGLGTTPVPAGGCRRTSDGVWPDGWAMTTNSSGDITIVPAAGAAFTGTCYVAGTAGGNLVLTDPALVPTRISSTASLTYSTFGGTGNCEEQSMTLSGAATGDVPTAAHGSALPAGIIVGDVTVSSANTVTIRLCRLAGTGTLSGVTFTAQIVRGM